MYKLRDVTSLNMTPLDATSIDVTQVIRVIYVLVTVTVNVIESNSFSGVIHHTVISLSSRTHYIHYVNLNLYFET